MRHAKLNKRFGRFRSAREALIRDLARSALIYESITTTKTKAKEARRLVERLISWGKDGSLKCRRLANKELRDHSLVSILFNDIALRFKNKGGGYTRIYSLLDRRGDGAEQVILELTEKKKKEKPQKIKTERKEDLKKEKVSPPAQAQEAGGELPTAPREAKKPEEHIEAKEKPKAEEKRVPALKEKIKPKEKDKPPAKFLGGLKKFFKKERDSL